MAFQAEETVGVQAQRQDSRWSNGKEKQLGGWCVRFVLGPE